MAVLQSQVAVCEGSLNDQSDANDENDLEGKHTQRRSIGFENRRLEFAESSRHRTRQASPYINNLDLDPFGVEGGECGDTQP